MRPLTLRDVLDSALMRHPLAEASRARVRAARGVRTSARAFGNPVLSYEVENAPFPGGELELGMERETMTTAMLPLESMFQRGPRARRAAAEVRVAEADAIGARQHLALEAARAYFRTALAQVRVEGARDLTAWLDSVNSYNRSRVAEGSAAEADLIRTELERDRAAAGATLEEAEFARARAQLATFLHDASPLTAELVAVDDAPFSMPQVAGAREGEPAAAPASSAAAARQMDDRTDLARRPDVRAARERVAAVEASVSSERSMIVRELGATFGAKRSAGATSMMAGLSLPFPIFDANRGQIVRAAAERDVATLELAARERTARAELAGAHEAARLLSERTAMLARSTDGRPSFLARADEARRIALGAYREGAGSLLQVIDAARTWNEARLAFYQTLYAQHESVAMLLFARGDDLLTELPLLAAGGRVNPR